MSVATVKFASQIEEDVLQALRAHAREQGRSISSVVTEAVADYLACRRVRPAFREAASRMIADHEELLKRLAR